MTLQHLSSSLRVVVGQCSSAGVKSVNEDAIGIRIPDEPTLTSKGAVAVLADGVSAAEGGREASATAVSSFLSDYYSTHETWSVERSASKVLSALNQWLYGLSTRYIGSETGYATTFSAAVFKSASAYLFHVGDSRIYRIRNGELEQLTRDHTARLGENQSYLTRALGIDVHLDVDFHHQDLQDGDLYIFTTDGLHNWITANDLLETFRDCGRDFQVGTLDPLCRQMVDRAAVNGSDDNLSIQAVRIQKSGDTRQEDLLASVSQLPFPPPLEKGHKIDGWTVVDELHASRRSEVYLVEDSRGQRAVLKAPSVNFEDDPAYIERFILEEWVGSRVSSGNVARVIKQRDKHFLYYLAEYVPGPTLGQLLKERSRLSVVDAQNIITQAISGLRAFHRRDVLHGDLKPDNIIYTDQGVKIIDFGSCHSAGIAEIDNRISRDARLGTLDYSAPEYLLNAPISPASDQFSLAVLLYELLTGQRPFGDAYGRCKTERDFVRLKYVPASRINPLVPVWLDGAIHKALSIDPADRYRALSEFARDITTPNPGLSPRRSVTADIRRSVFIWKSAFVAMVIVNLLLLSLWLGR